MTNSIQLPLNQLVAWKGNVRKTGAAEGIDELAASITAHGLLQALVVREGKRGKYEIIAGRRRFLALTQLAKQGVIKKDHSVTCSLAAETVDAAELSLAENVVRVAMHPADQFEAFNKLIASGAGTADVAARFGVTEKLIAQRMKLGRLSPIVLDAYRKGDIDLEVAQAFAISDDHAAQERVFADTPDWGLSAHTVRRSLTEGEIRASDKRVRFVGLDAYEAAGGEVRRDLFGDDDDAFVLDATLLDRLAVEKLATTAAEVSSEGWRWTEIVPDFDHEASARFGRLYPDNVPLSSEHQDEFDRLSEEYDELVDTNDDAEIDRLSAVEQRIEELNNLSQSWSGETLAIAGAVVSLGYDGGVSIARGLVPPEDRPARASATLAHDEPNSAGVRNGLSPKLIEDLTAQKTAAIGVELMTKPDIALAAVVHGLTLDVFYPGCFSDSCVRLSARSAHARSAIAKPESCRALAVISQEHERFGDRLPGNPAELWDWLLASSRDELLELLAYIAATAVDAVQRKGEHPDSSRLAHANRLAVALQLDMGSWFCPTAESYFGRVSRAQSLAAIDEANGSHAPSLEKLKKSELAVRAEQLLADKTWLPEPLRIAVNDNCRDMDAEAAE